ncbi:MAG TPA: ATP-dependent DNA helicase RecG [Gammaproteobacteria bacterium]|nr:ATP-dependent DNA helicase RecG [Gammaproteobacteria bacterium]
MKPDHAAFDQPIESLAGVGPKLGERLAKLGVVRVADLLYLLPQRYEDRTAIRALGSLVPGEKALIEGEVQLAEVAFRRRRQLLCRLADGTGSITLRFFHFTRTQQQSLVKGVRVRCYGEVRAGPAGLEMVHPEHRIINAQEPPPSATLTPIYPTTEGVHQQRLRSLVERALRRLHEQPPTDYLGDQIPEDWPALGAALEYLHQPPNDAELKLLLGGKHPCQRRVALEELVAQRLSLRRTAIAARTEQAYALRNPVIELAKLRASLPFRLTRAQQQAVDEILVDLGGDAPMHRLLQGDVGSGKTVVAAFAAMVAAASGYQTAIMAPTELLAEQHLASFTQWLRPLAIEVVGLIGSLNARARAAALQSIGNGTAQVVVGTHALFQEAVSFHKLALVVVDEQHRFGVHQRLKLKLKGENERRSPHQLIMTATPIPRTLAMTAYADLDCSVINELPPGRQPVRTVVMPEQRRAELVQRVAAHCATEQQAYWVCPLIEESELIDSSAASALEQELSAALPQLRIGLIHGRMKAADKEAAMRAFKEGSLDLLVATTVIEVGVDVPNATLMVVENAERMGLAQLHQLRGRVGRGSKASSCVLLYKPPLSSLARERLHVMRATNDGFEVAQKDLQLRGPGEVLGTRQTGVMQLRVADLLRDADLLPMVISISERLLERYPERVAPLIRRWIRGAAEYAKV